MLHSVRARLTLWYTAILGLVLIAFGAICYVLLSREIRAATDSSLITTAQEMAAAFADDVARGTNERDALLAVRYTDREVVVFSSSGQVVASSHLRFKPEERERVTELVRRRLTGFHTVAGGEEDDGIRVGTLPLDLNGRRYTVVVARDLDEQADRLESAARAVGLGIPLALMIASGGGYLLARKSLRPVTAMSMKARQISAATLDERITVTDERDELGFLATTLNDLLERLQRAFQSQRGFMADASHELRTPVSIIQGEADVALARTDRSAADYRESIVIMQKAARKLTRIVQNLFLLARSDAGSYPITRTRLYLDDLVQEIVRGMQSLATARGVALTCSGPPDIVISADEELLHRMLLNLVDNAVKFTPSGGKVHVDANCHEGTYTIRVTDTGPGIAPEYHDKVFDRFYRLGLARAEEGAGLGLPIARWIAEVHGGSLTIERSNESGTEFRVTLSGCEVA